MPIRPSGRDIHVTGGGKGVHKKGEGFNTGPVGGSGRPSSGTGTGPSHSSGSSGGHRASGSGGSGNRGGSGGGGLLRLIIIGAIILLGGGGGIGALLGGGGSGSSGTGTTSQPTVTTTSGQTSSASSSSASSGTYGSTGSDKESLLEALLGGYASSGYDGYSAPDLGSHTGSGYGSYGSGYDSYGSGSGSAGSSSSFESMLESLLGQGTTGSSGYSGTSGTSGYGGWADSGSSYDTGTISGTDSGLDLSSFSSLFGGGIAPSAAGITAGWNDGQDNRGKLNQTVAKGSRKKFTSLKGGGKDTVTIMVYMCGTDLESRNGMATADLSEMAAADISDNVNVIVYTGGCSGWRNNVVSSSVNQVYRVRKGGLEPLVENDGDRAMTDPTTLARFIKWCAKAYPANRNELIFWDHGSGSLSGYGYDQKHSREGSMDLSEIRDAIRAGGVNFDFVGFDACLMATVENALALSDYADYLLASEETEPGTGWYYTNWLNALSKDTGMDTLQLGRMIIDDFIEKSSRQAHGQSTTLSLVDLAELSHTFPAKFSAFSKSASSLIENKEFKTVSTARNSAREFAESTGVDQVDLADMAWKIGNEESMAMVDVLLNAVKYNRTSSSMCNSYGLSIYFPSSRLSKVDSMVNTYSKLGMDTDFTKCIRQYATVQTAGQSAAGGTGSVYDMLTGGGSYSSGWYSSPYESSSSGMGTDLLSQMIGSLLGGRSIPSDIEGLDASNTGYLKNSGLTAEQVTQILQENTLQSGSLRWSADSSGRHILSMPEDQWSQVSSLTVNMLFDDGEGYIDLGHDNVFNFTQGGDLIGETNRTWISINSQPVAYYLIGTVKDGDNLISMGRVPALLNDERVDLIIVFDAQNPYGYIAGARRNYIDGETETLAKALLTLNDGDTLRFLCDYYDYDGNYEKSYFLGEPQVIDGTPLISNTDVGEGGALISYRFTDLYGQEYWTQAIAE